MSDQWSTPGDPSRPPSVPPPPPPPDAAPAPIPVYLVAAPRWYSQRVLTTYLTWLFVANGAAAILAIAALAHRLSVINDIEDSAGGGLDLFGRAQDADDFVQTASVIVGLLLLATLIVFIIWQFRAAKNNEALGRQQPRLGPGWAIGGWFIPLAFFVIPVLVMQDIWRGADPAVPRGDPRWRISARSALVGWWWALLLLSLFVRGYINADKVTTTIAEVRTSDLLSLLGMMFRIAACVVAILMVRAITDRQEKCLRAQQDAWRSHMGETPA